MSKTAKKTRKAKKNVGYRLLAALIAVLCVVFVFLPIHVLKGENNVFSVEKLALFEKLADVFKSDNKLAGFLPTLTGSTILGVLSTLVTYGFTLALVVGLVIAVIGIFARKKSPALVRLATFILTWAFAAYALSVLCITSYVNSVKITYDLITIALAVAGAVLYFILLLIKLGKAAWINSIQFLLTLAYTASIVLAFTHEGHSVSVAMNAKNIWKLLVVALCALASLNLFISVCRASCKKGLAADPVRYILMLVAALGVSYIHYGAEIESRYYLLHAICAALIALVQLVISLAQLSVRKSKAIKTAKEDAVAEFKAEETIEAYPYEGGPVAGVELAEEVSPVEKTESPEATENAEEKTAATSEGEYSGKTFDPFIATLNETERAEFIDLYVLKCKAAMPEIPKYEVGGDNRSFFNKVFIYLGQYREKVSSELLYKMYNYSMKVS